MNPVRIGLPDGAYLEFPKIPNILEVAERISARLAETALGGIINADGVVRDVREPLNDGDAVEIITAKHPKAVEVIRHSAAHVLAQAVQEIWPTVKVTIGPVIEDGFYYDFDSPQTFLPEDLKLIELKMQEIIRRDLPVVKEVWSKAKAIQVFTEMGETFKVEIINELPVDEVSIYHQGSWFDLCRGPHVQRLGQIKTVKVMSLAGAYWRGNEANRQLQRIYGTAFFSQKELDEFIRLREEAKARDHRKLGRELGLFFLHELAPGSPFFTPKGAIIYNKLQDFIRELYVEYGYQEVLSPQLYDVELYHQSGHFANYRENMYFTQKDDDREFSFKPMNCPGHCLMFAHDKRSYRELPWRIADFGRLHRFERSGTLHGVTRVRSFCQDDAHIFCSTDQLAGEITAFMELLKKVYHTLGMTDYRVYLSTRPLKRMGTDEIWDQAESALAQALKDLNLAYEVNPGDGAFYGPKLDIVFIDALKRPWQLGTLQCDFNMPEAFQLKYVGSDNQDHTPVMLHRAILGSFERFLGVYLEHCAGRLPFWLSPEQVRILTLSSEQEAYARDLKQQLELQKLRVHVDDRGEKLGFKVREAQLAKIPIVLVLGAKEVEGETVTLRFGDGRQVASQPKDLVVNWLIQKNHNRDLLIDPSDLKIGFSA